LTHKVHSYNGVTDTYINDEHLKSVSAGSYTYNLYYDALGRCVKRTLNGVTTVYIYDGEKPILEYSGTNVARNVYGKGIDEILMRSETGINGGNPFYYQQDHEGNVTHLVNGSGNVIESYRYDAYGAPTFYNGSGTQISSTAYNNRFLFTGREYAATYRGTYVSPFKFYEYRARAYHPLLGRFMSEDHILADAGDYNLFRYCHNDPIDNVDPMGLDPEFWLIRDYVAPPNSFEARRAPADLYVKDNNKYTWLGRTNENGFIGNAQGVKQGDYKLVPKGDSWGPGRYKPDQPAITGKQPGLKPGQPNETYKNPALVHEKSNDGRADSTACVTCSSKTEDQVKQIMRENGNNVPLHIRDPARAQPAQQNPAHAQRPPDASSVEQRASRKTPQEQALSEHSRHTPQPERP
jgi:RHS repeat-associated protein